MKNYIWLPACLALVMAGLVAGCGGGGGDTTAATSASDTAATATTSTTTTSTTTQASGDATPDDVYNACLDALKNVGSQDFVQQGCGSVRDAFEQCMTQASNAPEGSARDQALQACQDAANKTVDGLQAQG
jgi:pectate lyase